MLPKNKFPVVELDLKPISVVVDVHEVWADIEHSARKGWDILAGVDIHHLLAWAINSWGYEYLDRDDPANNLYNLIDQFVGDEFTDELYEDLLTQVNDITILFSSRLESTVRPLLTSEAATVTLDRYQDGFLYIHVYNWLTPKN